MHTCYCTVQYEYSTCTGSTNYSVKYVWELLYAVCIVVYFIKYSVLVNNTCTVFSYCSNLSCTVPESYRVCGVNNYDNFLKPFILYVMLFCLPVYIILTGGDVSATVGHRPVISISRGK